MSQQSLTFPRDLSTPNRNPFPYEIGKNCKLSTSDSRMLAIARRRLVVSAALACWVGMVAVPARAVDAPPPGGLILHSNQRPTPAQAVIEDTLRMAVPENFKRPVQLYSEYLDDEWSSVQTYGAAEANFLRDKYGRRNIRVLVADALPALQFAMQYRDRIFSGVPIVHIAVARDRLAKFTLPADVVGNTENHDPAPTLELALRLHPQTTRLVIIRGGSDRDRAWHDRVRTAIAEGGNGHEVEYLDGLPTADVLRRVSALPPATIVFTPGYFVDGAGEVTTPRESVERIAQASIAPVYGAFDTQIGAGIVGGYMTRYADQAKEAAAIVVRLLNGTPATEIEPTSVARVPVVDARQLRRWGIDERLLPADTVVMFREPTAWQKYWWEFSLGIALVLLQATLIAALLIERRSRLSTASALAETQRQMNLAASAATLSMWSWDTARGYVETRARPREQSMALRDVVASVHPDDREGFERAVAKTLATGRDLDVEYRVVGANGAIRWVAARGRPAKDDPRRLIGIALDVTERKAAEQRAADDRMALRHMTRVSLVGQLSAAIAHQLNQPLSAILGNAEVAQKLLGRSSIDVPELRAICTDIVTENHRASEIIRRLRALYNRRDSKIEPIDLNQLVRETIDLLRPELLNRHVAPVTDLAPDLPDVDGSKVQLQQVVLNLALNAADAMNDAKLLERKLTIRTESSEGEVRLYVVDNGPGIPPASLGSLFDPFWSTKEGGMGMGLAICRTIVAAHHGRIVASNNPGAGATFCVGLPERS